MVDLGPVYGPPPGGCEGEIILTLAVSRLLDLAQDLGWEMKETVVCHSLEGPGEVPLQILISLVPMSVLMAMVQYLPLLPMPVVVSPA